MWLGGRVASEIVKGSEVDSQHRQQAKKDLTADIITAVTFICLAVLFIFP